MNSFQMPTLPNIKSIPEQAFDALSNEVEKFQRTLSTDFELGVSVFGADNVIHVRGIRRSGQMIIFEGVDSQNRVARLIQHYTQVNLQMVAVGKLAEQANRIGF